MQIVEVNAKDMNERQFIFFKKAAQHAYRSNLTQRHGCVVVLNDEIISTGFNHTYVHLYHKFSLHAEVDALRKIKRNVDLSNAELYVVRIGPESKGSPLRMSKPCDGCEKIIFKSKVGKVYYSIDPPDYIY